MDAKKVLIIQHHAISHLNAAMNISNLLKERGFDIYYVVNFKMAEYVAKHGFKYIISSTHPVTEHFVNSKKTIQNKKYTYLDELRDSAVNMLLEYRKDELNKIIENVDPDIIIEDTFVGTDFALIYDTIKRKNIRYFYLETMLSSIDSFGFPYLKGRSMPHQKAKILIEYIKHRVTHRIKRAWKKIRFLGLDSHSNLMREIKNQNIPLDYKLDNDNYIDLTFTNITTLVTNPLELEFFKQSQAPNRHYLGLFVNQNASKVIEMDERLVKVINGGNKIIYISFGTVFVEREIDSILDFMQKINKIAPELGGVDIVFSCGKTNQIEKFSQLSNINIFKFVPQVELLKYCSVFVTHGGLNSVKESINAIVPMLALPLEIDQIGNARKITYNKFGLFDELKRINIKTLKANILNLLNNDVYKTSLQKFKHEVEEKYDLEGLILSILENGGKIK